LYDRVTRSACFVCRIVEGRPLFPNPRIVYEDDRVIAFLNQFPSQEGYTIVCPKRHAERFETDLSTDEWAHLQAVVREVARAVTDVTGAIRVYIASLGSPERNAHIHIHVCPCPAGTPFEKQQFAAMDLRGGQALLTLSDARLDELARSIAEAIRRADTF
ncbi:MAG TPA: HIT family protein, partial [Dehalococcoidia bacterium]|nr:HIT family protein [Dehalococcoidia bacterium]